MTYLSRRSREIREEEYYRAHPIVDFRTDELILPNKRVHLGIDYGWPAHAPMAMTDHSMSPWIRQINDRYEEVMRARSPMRDYVNYKGRAG